MPPSLSRHEQDRQPRTEAQILADFGYDHCLDMPLTLPDGSPVVGEDGSTVTGGRFLETYRDPERRQHTQDLLDGYLGMDAADPDYAGAREYISTYLKAYFGEPNPGTA